MRCTHCQTDNPTWATTCGFCDRALPPPSSEARPTGQPLPDAGAPASLSYAPYGPNIPPAFRPASGLAKAVNILFVVYMAFTLIAAGTEFWVIRHLSLEGYDENQLSPSEGANTCVLLLSTLVYLAVGVVFLVWMHHVSRNLRALGLERQRFSPGSVVWWWFVPFANLVRPYQAMREIWTASEPPYRAPGSDAADIRRPASLLAWWWGIYLVGNVVGTVVGRLAIRANTAEALISSGWVTIVSDILDIVGAILAILVVRSVDARQRCRYAAFSEPSLPVAASPAGS